MSARRQEKDRNNFGRRVDRGKNVAFDIFGNLLKGHRMS